MHGTVTVHWWARRAVGVASLLSPRRPVGLAATARLQPRLPPATVPGTLGGLWTTQVFPVLPTMAQLRRGGRERPPFKGKK